MRSRCLPYNLLLRGGVSVKLQYFFLLFLLCSSLSFAGEWKTIEGRLEYLELGDKSIGSYFLLVDEKNIHHYVVYNPYLNGKPANCENKVDAAKFHSGEPIVIHAIHTMTDSSPDIGTYHMLTTCNPGAYIRKM